MECYTLFINGIENIFTIISKKIDNIPIKGENSHIDLLNQMASKTDKREPIISENLKDILTDYLKFRHLFRNIYTFNLDWNRMKPLIYNLKNTLDEVYSQIFKFLYEEEIENLYKYCYNEYTEKEILDDINKINLWIDYSENNGKREEYLVLVKDNINICLRLEDNTIFKNEEFGEVKDTINKNKHETEGEEM